MVLVFVVSLHRRLNSRVYFWQYLASYAGKSHLPRCGMRHFTFIVATNHAKFIHIANIANLNDTDLKKSKNIQRKRLKPT